MFNRKRKRINKLVKTIDQLEKLIGEYLDVAEPYRYIFYPSYSNPSERLKRLLESTKAAQMEEARKQQLKREVEEILQARELGRNKTPNCHTFHYSEPAVTEIKDPE